MQRSNSRNPLDIKPDAQLRGTQTSTYNCTWRNSSPFSLARSRRNNRSGIAAAFADRWPSPMMNQMKPRRLFINNGRSVGTARRPGQPVQLQATASVLAPIIYRHATNRIWLAYNHTFICAYSLSLSLSRYTRGGGLCLFFLTSWSSATPRGSDKVTCDFSYAGWTFWYRFIAVNI